MVLKKYRGWGSCNHLECKLPGDVFDWRMRVGVVRRDEGGVIRRIFVCVATYLST